MFIRGCLAIWIGCGLLCACSRAETAPPDDPDPKRSEANMKVLYSSFAGSWYPGRERPLRKMIDEYVEAADEVPTGKVTALILPHAGYRYSGPTAAHGIRQLKPDAFDRAIVIGPSHRYPLVNEASLPDATHYGTPLGKVPLDMECIERLLEHDVFRRVAGVHEKEHSVQMEIPLLQRALGEFTLVPIVVGQLDHATVRDMARVLKEQMDDRTLIVASTDFTHYGAAFDYVPFTENIPEEIRKVDMDAFAFVEAKDPEGFMGFCREEKATICGRNAVAVLMAMLSENDRGHLLHYDTSGRMTDDFSHSVSYLSAAFARSEADGPESEIRLRQASPSSVDPAMGVGGRSSPEPPIEASEAVQLSSEEKTHLLELARKTIAHRFAEGREPSSIKDLQIEATEGMEQTAGAFVTLTKNGRLRGCIGDIRAHRPLYRSVMANAVNAALEDPRFKPMTPDEVDEIEIEISALSPMREVADASEIVIGRHGVLLRKGRRSAVYLPQVAPEQGWDLEETLSHLSMKAGLAADGWREGTTFEVFEATVFSEHAP